MIQWLIDDLVRKRLKEIEKEEKKNEAKKLGKIHVGYNGNN